MEIEAAQRWAASSSLLGLGRAAALCLRKAETVRPAPAATAAVAVTATATRRKESPLGGFCGRGNGKGKRREPIAGGRRCKEAKLACGSGSGKPES